MWLIFTDSWTAAEVSLRISHMSQSSIYLGVFPGAAGSRSRWEKSSSTDSQQGNLRPHSWIFLNEPHTSEAFNPCDCSCSVLREQGGFWLEEFFHRLLTGHAVTLVGRKHPISQEAETKARERFLLLIIQSQFTAYRLHHKICLATTQTHSAAIWFISF